MFCIAAVVLALNQPPLAEFAKAINSMMTLNNPRV